MRIEGHVAQIEKRAPNQYGVRRQRGRGSPSLYQDSRRRRTPYWSGAPSPDLGNTPFGYRTGHLLISRSTRLFLDPSHPSLVAIKIPSTSSADVSRDHMRKTNSCWQSAKSPRSILERCRVPSSGLVGSERPGTYFRPFGCTTHRALRGAHEVVIRPFALGVQGVASSLRALYLAAVRGENRYVIQVRGNQTRDSNRVSRKRGQRLTTHNRQM